MSVQREIMSRMIAELPDRYPGCGILLAGSVQRGEEREDSDLDLFVVFPDNGPVRLQHEESPEGIKIDLALFPEGGFQRAVEEEGYKFWMFSRAEIVYDPTGIAARNREIALSYFERHPAVDEAWAEQMSEVKRHKADGNYLPKHPTWAGFAEHVRQMVGERAASGDTQEPRT